MKVGEDLDEFMREIRSRFDGTPEGVIEDLTEKSAGFEMSIAVEAAIQLRDSMPANHRRIDPARFMAVARRISIEREQAIAGSPKPNRAQGIPFDPSRPRPDTRTPEQKRWDEHREKSKAWVDSLDPAHRDELMEQALHHWPDGDERAMYRAWGIKSCLVRDEMIRVSRDRGEAA